MNKFGFLLLFAMVAVASATMSCGGDDPDDVAPVTLDVPSGVAAVTAETSETSLTFSWNAVAGAAKYTYRLTDESGAKVVEASTSLLRVTISNLHAASSYGFCVKAVGGVGTVSSDFSAAVYAATSGGSVTPPTPSTVEFDFPEAERDGVIRAFPGAEGGGMYTTGGRGGRIYRVTNLNDSGAGSLREAVEASGPRVVVFDVAGTIALSKALKITNGDITIAGQTAPGDGICLKNYTLYIDADNVVIRYIRSRMGDEARTEDDAMGGRYHSNIIVDHCSMSWSTDECASLYANSNFTMQWCLIAESLCKSVHGKGDHGYGGIWGGRNASFHHNLLAHHVSRNPRFDHPYVYQSNDKALIAAYNGNVDYRNNAVYNWGQSENSYGGELCKINMVANYYKEGPASKSNKYFFVAYGNTCSSCATYGYEYEEIMPKIYMDGNVYVMRDGTEAGISASNYTGVYDKDKRSWTSYSEDTAGKLRLTSPLAVRKDDATNAYTTTHGAAAAFDLVTTYGGAVLSRDAVDRRAADDARNGTASCTDGGNGSTGGIVDTQSAVGGWPELKATAEQIARRKTDSDGDGIPDYYEDLFGLDRNSAADGAARTLDPQGLYTNFEVYLHYLVKDITKAQTAGGTYTRL